MKILKVIMSSLLVTIVLMMQNVYADDTGKFADKFLLEGHDSCVYAIVMQTKQRYDKQGKSIKVVRTGLIGDIFI